MCGAKNTEASFWAHVDKSGECWIWTGKKRARYGRVKREGKYLSAHRLAWALANGPIPAGLLALHRCDNPSCVRPDHLWLGTQADNMADRDAKGRQATGMRTRPETRAKGERSRSAKLTAKKVIQIRRMVAGGKKAKEIAAMFGVTERTIYNISQRETWKHLKPDVAAVSGRA